MCDPMSIGTVLAIGGSAAQGIMGYQSGRAQEAAIKQQAATERQLSAVQDQRTRAKMLAQIGEQRAQLAARGLDLSSVSSVALGQAAAQEMSFESQAIRSGGAARQAELSSEARAARWGAVGSLLRGTVGVAQSVLSAPPDLWAGFDRSGGGVLK